MVFVVGWNSWYPNLPQQSKALNSHRPYIPKGSIKSCSVDVVVKNKTARVLKFFMHSFLNQGPNMLEYHHYTMIGSFKTFGHHPLDILFNHRRYSYRVNKRHFNNYFVERFSRCGIIQLLFGFLLALGKRNSRFLYSPCGWFREFGWLSVWWSKVSIDTIIVSIVARIVIYLFFNMVISFWFLPHFSKIRFIKL